MKELIDRLEQEHILEKKEFIELLKNRDAGLDEYVFSKARKIRQRHYGNKIYVRGLIEFTNYCKNNCLYCGIRCSNRYAQRYRLTKQEILECCAKGYELGFRTFVLQGGEDIRYTDEKMLDLITTIKHSYPDCALTLSIGEKSRKTYQAYFDAGADRYLLRHETANENHYKKLHPKEMSFQNRRRCLWDLKEIGYQVGCGFMVGSPGQKPEYLAEDLLWIHQFDPHMVGVGPFIPHHDTEFADQSAGTLEMTLFLLGLIRIMQPKVLLPATTALGTIHPEGREMGILAGANVVMPNLSPTGVREKYLLYDNKICTGDESAEYCSRLKCRMASLGYQVVVDRGDFLNKRGEMI